MDPYPVCNNDNNNMLIILYVLTDTADHMINDSLKAVWMQITQTRKCIFGINSHTECILKYHSQRWLTKNANDSASDFFYVYLICPLKL